MNSTLKVHPTKSDHHINSLDAPLVIVEYGDFECPYTARSLSVIEKLLKEFGEDICFVYRHFPLSNIHSHSVLAALASEAADHQGKFWEMCRLLFQHQEDLSFNTLRSLAEKLNLEMNQFFEDLDRSQMMEKVSSDFNSAARSGAHGTPTLFLNGNKYEGNSTYEELREAVLQALGMGETHPY